MHEPPPPSSDAEDPVLDETAELLDVLDADGAPTGRAKPRVAVHRDGDWHRAFHLWIVRENRLVLLQRRARAKDLEGGKVDVTVGGHYRHGETLHEVVREVEEELGLAVQPSDLVHLGTVRSERRYPHATDREFQEVYALACEQPLEHYGLRCREVFALYEVPLPQAIALYREGRYVAAAGFDCQGRVNNALLVADDLIAGARETTAAALERVQAWLAREVAG